MDEGGSGDDGPWSAAVKLAMKELIDAVVINDLAPIFTRVSNPRLIRLCRSVVPMPPNMRRAVRRSTRGGSGAVNFRLQEGCDESTRVLRQTLENGAPSFYARSEPIA